MTERELDGSKLRVLCIESNISGNNSEESACAQIALNFAIVYVYRYKETIETTCPVFQLVEIQSCYVTPSRATLRFWVRAPVGQNLFVRFSPLGLISFADVSNLEALV